MCDPSWPAGWISSPCRNWWHRPSRWNTRTSGAPTITPRPVPRRWPDDDGTDPGAAPEDLAPGRRALRGGHQLSLSPGTGRGADAIAAELRVGGAASFGHLHRPDRNREIVAGAGAGAQGLPGWLSGAVPARREAVPGTGRSAPGRRSEEH